jgi:hypothetical protein
MDLSVETGSCGEGPPNFGGRAGNSITAPNAAGVSGHSPCGWAADGSRALEKRRGFGSNGRYWGERHCAVSSAGNQRRREARNIDTFFPDIWESGRSTFPQGNINGNTLPSPPAAGDAIGSGQLCEKSMKRKRQKSIGSTLLVPVIR